ncbi:MAG: serine hydrolase domain-containing protein [Chloroflexota bacterium]
MTFPLHVSVDRLSSTDSQHIGQIIQQAVPSVAPALALCVWQDGQPVFDIHGGWIDPAAPGRPVHGEAMFDLASVSKLFTATAFLGLVSEGSVALDDAVVSVLPEFGEGGARRVDGGQEPLSRRLLPVPADRRDWTVDPSVVTFRQLLSHTSGMAPWRSIFRDTGAPPPPPARTDAQSSEARRQAGIDAVLASPFVAKPGAEVLYSDLGFMALGESVARLSGAPLDEVIRRHISGPLELDSLGYLPIRSGLALERIVPTSFDDDWRKRRCRGEVEDENAAGLGGIAGHAGLFASARDVARFGQAWLTRDARLGLDIDLFVEACTDQTPSMAAARGLGWQVQGEGADYLAPFGPQSIGHSGFTGTSLVLDPSRDLVITLLTNRVFAGRSHDGIETLRVEIHEALAGAFGHRSERT